MSQSNHRPVVSLRSLFPRVQVQLPGFNMITGLVLVLTVIHLLMVRIQGSAEGQAEAAWYYINFGLSWHGFSDGKIWQIVTYGLMHANWAHLLMNLLMLWLIGGRVIHILGHRRCFWIIVLGTVAGGLMHLLTGLLFLRTGYPESHLVGISGACLALLVTLTTLSPDSRMWPVPISGKNLGLGFIIASLLLWLMQPGLGLPLFSGMGELMVNWAGPELFQISHGCHLGGALAGWWLARRLLAPTPSLETLQKLRQKREKKIGLGDLG
ncbi:MAG: rhomboid family intramembrane serine protease [Verrucomicrobiae bacterium]|nr:rhomboid family intramembrane serine protease [Verrucomicrobiae bacterium]NNJ85579.1 rhomboid family intramembrane serine protease [Akkermansiaceae bacterium]